MDLQHRIADRIGEFLIFAVPPPRLATGPEQSRQIADITLARLRLVGIDGLVLYDIDDESDRNPNNRPFPFLPTMDPAAYLTRDLVRLDVPAIVYRAVSKHSEPDLRAWLRDRDPARALAVFVGASFRGKPVSRRKQQRDGRCGLPTPSCPVACKAGSSRRRILGDVGGLRT